MKTVSFAIINLILYVSIVVPIYTQTDIVVGTFVAGGGFSYGTTINVSGTVGQVIVGASHNNTSVVGAGFWYMIRSSLGTGIEPIEYGKPAEFRLEQNFPNPFNPTTTIRFGIPETGFVSLKIYDLLGREVTSLIDEELPVGRYEVVWDAAGVASGVYIYSLTGGTFQQTKKLILLK
jgi:hypothetical protein